MVSVLLHNISQDNPVEDFVKNYVKVEVLVEVKLENQIHVGFWWSVSFINAVSNVKGKISIVMVALE